MPPAETVAVVSWAGAAIFGGAAPAVGTATTAVASGGGVPIGGGVSAPAPCATRKDSEREAAATTDRIGLACPCRRSPAKRRGFAADSTGRGQVIDFLGCRKTRSMRLGPVLCGADVHDERHRELHRVLHRLADSLPRSLPVAFRHFENQLVVHRQHHARASQGPL